jgi:hypothetical protein
MNKYLKFEDLHDFWNFSFRDSNSYNKSSAGIAAQRISENNREIVSELEKIIEQFKI